MGLIGYRDYLLPDTPCKILEPYFLQKDIPRKVPVRRSGQNGTKWHRTAGVEESGS